MTVVNGDPDHKAALPEIRFEYCHKMAGVLPPVILISDTMLLMTWSRRLD
jgi:hypothetical protein